MKIYNIVNAIIMFMLYVILGFWLTSMGYLTPVLYISGIFIAAIMTTDNVRALMHINCKCGESTIIKKVNETIKLQEEQTIEKIPPLVQVRARKYSSRDAVMFKTLINEHFKKHGVMTVADILIIFGLGSTDVEDNKWGWGRSQLNYIIFARSADMKVDDIPYFKFSIPNPRLLNERDFINEHELEVNKCYRKSNKKKKRNRGK